MVTGNPLSFLVSPTAHWKKLSDLPLEKFPPLLVYPLILAMLPAAAWYYGVTEIGWRVGDGDIVRLTQDSARAVIILFYLAMIISLTIIGYMTHWMSKTYGANTSVAKSLCVVSIVATPLFLSGLVGFYPLLWVDLLVGIAALSWSVYLLYTGIPLAMKLTPEQGFLYASAILAVCLVITICIMGASVILWDMGFAPVFID